MSCFLWPLYGYCYCSQVVVRLRLTFCLSKFRFACETATSVIMMLLLYLVSSFCFLLREHLKKRQRKEKETQLSAKFSLVLSGFKLKRKRKRKRGQGKKWRAKWRSLKGTTTEGGWVINHLSENKQTNRCEQKAPVQEVPLLASANQVPKWRHFWQQRPHNLIRPPYLALFNWTTFGDLLDLRGRKRERKADERVNTISIILAELAIFPPRLDVEKQNFHKISAGSNVYASGKMKERRPLGS